MKSPGPFRAPCRILLALSVVALLGRGREAAAQQSDPYSARVRSVSSVTYPAFQGADCITLKEPKALVWRLLVAPERAASWLLAEHKNITPRTARYAKRPTATKGDTLTIDVETENGTRQVELKVVAEITGQALALQVTKDDADILDKGMALVTYTFVLEDRPDGTTDLYWAWHYDSDSPFSAALFSMSAVKTGERRRQAGLLTFKALLDAAAALKDPPLHDTPASEPIVRRK